MKKKDVKLPVKKSMNLYQVEKKEDPTRTLVFGVLAIIVVVAVFGKILILDKLSEMTTVQQELFTAQDTLSAMNTKLQGYPQLKEDYYRYAEIYSSEDEILMDRITITTLLNEASQDIAHITSTSIEGNAVSIKVVTDNLDNLAQFRITLENNPLVKDVTVYSASRSTGDVVSTVAFKCVVEGNE